ncbi:MAG: hypothetical protein JST48_04965 [Bacteroidetes bacterium]|nr:hypothetical protein [Bacteroidota bacterium]
MEYNQYYEYFHCDDPKIYDEVSWESMSNFLNKGFWEIDLRLHNRAECFDFMETKKLLEQGANMNVFIYENEQDSSILMRIEGEASYLNTCHVVPEFEVFQNKGYDQEFDLKYMFGNLLGLAAHEDMSHLFSLYNHKDQ